MIASTIDGFYCTCPSNGWTHSCPEHGDEGRLTDTNTGNGWWHTRFILWEKKQNKLAAKAAAVEKSNFHDHEVLVKLKQFRG